MTDTITADAEDTDAGVPARWHRHWVAVLLLVATIVLAGVAASVAGIVHVRSTHHSRTMPHSAAMEANLGVRFSRVAVVGDGGLITVSYVVLDSEKAGRFQSDVAHPPVLTSEARPVSTKRVSLMKQGHTLRAGQTYYLVYENTRGALRHGEQVTLGYGPLRLKHVPVL
jgi:hypothetical protein